MHFQVMIDQLEGASYNLPKILFHPIAHFLSGEEEKILHDIAASAGFIGNDGEFILDFFYC